MRCRQLKRLRLERPRPELVTRDDNRSSYDVCHDSAWPKEDITMTSGRDAASHNCRIMVTDEDKRWLGDVLPPLYAKLGHMTSRRDAANRNSPILVTDEAKRWLGDLLPPLREFYAKLGQRNITDTELALEIERRFGDQLVQKVCIPHGLFMGACLLIAISALKEPLP